MSESALVIIPLVLTLVMFTTREMMLGFPCVIFWAIYGGYCYGQSEATWDVYYLLFFASMGMTIFSAVAMYGLREKRDTTGEKSMENETSYVDEEQEESGDEESPRTKRVRERAERRRNKR